ILPSIFIHHLTTLSLHDALPILPASDIPENLEIVEGSGFTFRHGDRNDLERMLRLLISEPKIRKAAADKARETVWKHYLWSRVRSEEHTSELQSLAYLVCRLLLE